MQLSIVPPVEVELDIGEGRKTYGLRFTKFAIIALAQHGDMMERLIDRREDGSLDSAGSHAKVNALSMVEQARYGATLIWSMLVAEHPHIKFEDLLVNFGPEELIDALPKALEAVTAAMPDKEGEPPNPPQPKPRARRRKRSPESKPSSASSADFGQPSISA